MVLLTTRVIRWCSFFSLKLTVAGRTYLAILISLNLICPHIAFAQNSPLDDKLAPSLLQHDFHVLCRILEEHHPSLHSYVSVEAWNALKQELTHKLQEEKTWREFYTLLSRLIAAIRCEHTVLRVSEKVYDYLIHQSSGLFPAEIRIVGDTVVMFQNLAEYTPSAHAIILAIDNTDTSSLLKEFSDYLSNDGLNELSKLRTIETYFSLFYAVLKGEKNSFYVTLKDISTGQVYQTNLSGISYKTFRLRKLQWYAQKTTIGTYHDYDVFVLRLKDFERRRNWSSLFRYLKRWHIDKLIIDLRDNKGGFSDEAKILLQYLIPEKILFPYVFLTKSKTIRFDSLIEGSSSQKRRSFRYIRQTPLLEDSLTIFAKVPKISPYRYVFKGKIAVLINGNTSSAAVQLAATLHHYRRAYFFGEETGGRYSGGNGGVIFTVVLPHSSIKLQLPMLRYYNQVTNRFPNRGLHPDFFIPSTVDNLLNNQDEVLQKALEWLMNH